MVAAKRETVQDCRPCRRDVSLRPLPRDILALSAIARKLAMTLVGDSHASRTTWDYAGLPELPPGCVLEANASRKAWIIRGCTEAETETGRRLIGVTMAAERNCAGLPALTPGCVLEADASRRAFIICGRTKAGPDAGHRRMGGNHGSRKRVRLCRTAGLAAGLCPCGECLATFAHYLRLHETGNDV